MVLLVDSDSSGSEAPAPSWEMSASAPSVHVGSSRPASLPSSAPQDPQGGSSSAHWDQGPQGGHEWLGSGPPEEGYHEGCIVVVTSATDSATAPPPPPPEEPQASPWDRVVGVARLENLTSHAGYDLNPADHGVEDDPNMVNIQSAMQHSLWQLSLQVDHVTEHLAHRQAIWAWHFDMFGPSTEEQPRPPEWFTLAPQPDLKDWRDILRLDQFGLDHASLTALVQLCRDHPKYGFHEACRILAHLLKDMQPGGGWHQRSGASAWLMNAVREARHAIMNPGEWEGTSAASSSTSWSAPAWGSSWSAPTGGSSGSSTWAKGGDDKGKGKGKAKGKDKGKGKGKDTGRGFR